ncbi:aminoglycoside phosphotransferase family protein [Neobacillus piezotolerans]|uniref:Aminoglycoside phosphotransferase family protein n=1 Tax=Neobacillus piezotolerans TaxID=2259171 RepID=A0A3D8GVP7_9BACI|nr:aminoglycoside phosphotransferase family protein [Neobacillus piezotolerans]
MIQEGLIAFFVEFFIKQMEQDCLRNNIQWRGKPMLANQHLSTETIAKVLQEHYGFSIKNIALLPIGHDPNASVYQVTDIENKKYFLKLNKGGIWEVGVKVPYYLHSYGIEGVISPMNSKTRQLWIKEEEYTWTIYPFIESQNGYETVISESQWVCFGQTLKEIHSLELPDELTQLLPNEDFSSKWCGTVRKFDQLINTNNFDDPISASLAEFWKKNRLEIIGLVENTERISEQLKQHKFNYVLCHADLHPGNIVIDKNKKMLIVDWDSPILAPKERDLMFIGGGHRFKNENIDAFYKGYGATQIDQLVLTYYRNERIVADIAADSTEILEEKGSQEDREVRLYLLSRQFEPNREVSVALNDFRKTNQ